MITQELKYFVAPSSVRLERNIIICEHVWILRSEEACTLCKIRIIYSNMKAASLKLPVSNNLP